MVSKRLSLTDQAEIGPGILGSVSYLFAVLSIVDSSVHLDKNVDSKEIHGNDWKTSLSFALMSIRLIICLIYLTLICVSKKYPIRPSIHIICSFIYGLSMTIILIVSCLVIQFKYASISLICQIIASYIGIVVSFKLLIIKYRGNDSGFGKVLKVISDNALAMSTLFSVVLAVVIGIILRDYDYGWNERSLMYIGFIGDIFLRMLKCLVLPLIFSSLVFAMGDIDTKLFGKIGLRTVVYFLTTTIIAIILGIILVLSIEPGKRGAQNEVSADPKSVGPLTTEDTILDLIRNLFPDNIVKACFVSYITVLSNQIGNQTLPDGQLHDWKIGSGESSGVNILGIVVFAIVFGVIIGQMKEEGKPLANFFRAFNNSMMTMTVIVINFTPLAVMFLVLSQILKVKELSDLLGSVGWYTFTVLLGFFIQGIILLPLIYFILTRNNPYKMLAKIMAPMMTAFGTASSTATIPATIQALEEKMKFDRRIVRFLVPVGATINMDGTGVFEPVAAIFIAQYRGIELDVVKVLIIGITSLAASIGAAGIPQASLVTLVIVLNAVGLPVEDTALIIVIDWLIDRFRTVINVLGDAYGAGIVHHMSKSDLGQNDTMDLSNDRNGFSIPDEVDTKYD